MLSNLPPGTTQEQIEREFFGEAEQLEPDENESFDRYRDDCRELGIDWRR